MCSDIVIFQEGIRIKIYVGMNASVHSRVGEDVKKRLSEMGEVRYFDKFEYTTKEDIIENIKDAELLIGGPGTPLLDKELLSHANNLKIYMYVAGSLAGKVNEDTYSAGIKVFGANVYGERGVAEATVADMFFGLRKINEQIDSMRAGEWKSAIPLGIKTILGKTVGILGFGMIAKEVVKFLKPFNCKIKVWADYDLPDEEADKYGVEKVSMEELLSTSDIISMHMGLNEKTCGLVGRDKINLIKEDALIVNTGRAGIFDEEALMERFVEGKNFGVLDVFVDEPLPEDHIYRNLPNVIATAHSSGSVDGDSDVWNLMLDDVERYLNGTKAEDIKSYVSEEYVKNMTDYEVTLKVREQMKNKKH